MKFQFLVTAEVSHVEGKFASRDDLEDKLTTELENSNPDSLTSDDEAEYTVDSWSVEPYTAPKPERKTLKSRRQVVTAIETEIGIPITIEKPPDPDINF